MKVYTESNVACTCTVSFHVNEDAFAEDIK